MYTKTRQLLADLVTDQIVPGVSYALIDHSRVLTDVFGWRELVPKRLQLHAGSQYDLASLTKIVGTTTVIFQLIAQGKVQLEDPVQKYLPAFQDERVQLWHLLTHTSGIAGYIPNRDRLSAADLKAALLKLPVTATFEHEMIYTDVGFLYLGWVIEQVCGKSVQQVITEWVLQPLKLAGATFTPDPANCVPTNRKDGQLLQGVVHDPKAHTLGRHCGSAGLFATLADLVQFSQWYLGQRPDLPELISRSFIAQLYADHTRHHLQRSLGWALRFAPTDQHPLLFHSGYTGTFIVLDQQLQQGLIVLTNRIHPVEENPVFLDRRHLIVDQFMAELPSN